MPIMNRGAVDRVMESSTTTGTGTYTLSGAVTGYQSFALAVATGTEVPYCAMEVDANGVPSGGWEVGLGTYTLSGTTLARTEIYESSNADAAVNWGAGTRRIFLTRPARNNVPRNGWTVVNSLRWNNDLAPDHICVTCKDDAGVQLRLLTRPIGTWATYTVTATLRGYLAAANSGLYGLHVYDGTKSCGIELLGGSEASGGIQRLRVQRFTNITTASTTPAGPTNDLTTVPVTLRIVNNGVTRKYFYYENSAFTEFYSEGTTDFLTEDRVAIAVLSQYGGRDDSMIYVDVMRWELLTT